MHKKPRILKLLTMAALLWINLFLCSFARAAADIDYSRIGWWNIKFTEINNGSNGCYAVANFQGQTSITLSLYQQADGYRQWVVHISNPQWAGWIGSRKQHILHFVAAKRWQGTFSVANDNSLYSFVSVDFMNSLADAYTLTIMSANNYVLTHLSMQDSEATIRAVVNCVRDHPPSSSHTPEARAPSETTKPTVSSGTAFFVAPGVLVTNHHVVKECGNDIQVRYPDQASYKATISGLDETNDLVLLRTDMSSRSVASFRFGIRRGEPVATYGFPYSSLLSSSGNFTSGNVTALTGMKDDSRFIQISTPVQPGNSGGPLLDMSGNVVGVVEGQLNAILMMQLGSVPQNVNFAIQAPMVVNFLSTKGVTPKIESQDTSTHRDLPASDVADMAEKFSVQIFCEGSQSETSEAVPPPPKSRDLPASTNPPTALVEQKAKEFVLSLQARWSRPNLEGLAGLDALYADEVMYYGK